MILGKSLEDYLEAILVLWRERGKVRSVDLAAYMGFSKPSVSHAVKELTAKELLVKGADGCLHMQQIRWMYRNL